MATKTDMRPDEKLPYEGSHFYLRNNRFLEQVWVHGQPRRGIYFDLRDKKTAPNHKVIKSYGMLRRYRGEERAEDFRQVVLMFYSVSRSNPEERKEATYARAFWENTKLLQQRAGVLSAPKSKTPGF